MVHGGYWWLWVVKKKLGTLRKGFERKKEKGISVFQGYTKNKACNTQVFLLSGKEAFLTHQKTYRRSQRSNHGHLSYKPPDQKDPTVNEYRRVLLPRQLKQLP